jgi:cell division protein FtsZ
MADAGSALMGIGVSSGKSRAREAAIAAISSPLLECSIEGARGVVFNITGGTDLTLHEVNAAAEAIYEVVDPNANIIFGAVIDDRLQGEVRITVIATGFTGEVQAAVQQSVASVRVAPNTSKRPTTQQPAVNPPTSTPSSTPTPTPTPEPKEKPGLDIPDFLRNRQRPRN